MLLPHQKPTGNFDDHPVGKEIQVKTSDGPSIFKDNKVVLASLKNQLGIDGHLVGKRVTRGRKHPTDQKASLKMTKRFNIHNLQFCSMRFYRLSCGG
jgi:hypothetical protein